MHFLRLFLFLPLLLCFLGCSKKDDHHPLRVGVTNGPHAKIAEFVMEQARMKNLPVEIVYFDDFIQPNVALDAGEIDLNIYQHQPFLDEQIQSRGYKIESMAKAILLPLGLYGKESIKNISEIPNEAKILIPVDPTNGARSLILLEKAGLLSLKNHSNPTLFDLQSNKKNLKLVEVDAPLLPRLLKEDADLAVINADWIIVAGMDPKKALFTEDAKNSPYVNVIAARIKDKNNPQIQQFIEIYQSDSVKNFIADTFKGAVMAAW